jgi:hypothetical protein
MIAKPYILAASTQITTHQGEKFNVQPKAVEKIFLSATRSGILMCGGYSN